MQGARCTLIFAASLLLISCAGTLPREHMWSSDPETDDYDANKVDTVTQWAHTHGATVVWVNYPVKHRPHDIANAPPSSQPSN
jgi:hypothetical protein